MQELTQEELKRQLHYDPLTGIFIRLISNSNRLKVGDVAGSVKIDSSGKSYLYISINSKTYSAHRLAVLYMTGRFPLHQVDHIKGNGLDNIWSKIRESTAQENAKNQRLFINNKSGFSGVYWYEARRKWHAQIKHGGKLIHLGLFADKNAAIAVRQAANIKYGYHENHGQVRPL